MTLAYTKIAIFNIMINIKEQINKIITSDKLYLTNNDAYILCFEEIFNILIMTLGKLENVYYKYFLYPRISALC